MKSKRSKACDIPKKVKDMVWERDNQRCIICHSPNAMPNAHYIRRSRGGLGIPQNIVTLCTFAGNDCHSRFDNGTGEEQAYFKQKVWEYLQGQYPGLSEEELIYRKG